MAFSVRGKTAIVTGSGSGHPPYIPSHQRIPLTQTGINLCFANLLLSRGCNVLFADLALRPEAQEAVNKHSANGGGKGRAAFQKTDVVKWRELEAMFGAAEKEFGSSGADIVVPGAGVYEPVCFSCPKF